MGKGKWKREYGNRKDGKGKMGNGIWKMEYGKGLLTRWEQL